jgi:iron complex outermembrane receptor protein
MLPTQSREYAGAQFSNKKQLPNYFLQADFSLSEKLHLETGLAFNTTRYSLRDLCNSDENLYTFGIWSPQQDSPIDLLKTRRFMRPKGVFDTSFGNIDSRWDYTSLKPEIGWNYELGLKLHGLNNKLYTELTFLVLK